MGPMQPFEYHAPTSIKGATALLAGYKGRARPLAGGTDLLVKLRLGTLAAEHIVDIKRIPETTRILFDAKQGLTIGAAVPCAEICEHREARRRYPGLVDAASLIGGAAIQGRATLGGNLCNAAPSADSAPALIVLGAAASSPAPRAGAGCRWRISARPPAGPRSTPGEMLVAIHLPLPRPRSASAYLRFIPRGEMDIAVAGVGVWLAVERGLITKARVALAAVAPRPLLVPDAGAALVGRPPGAEAFARGGGRRPRSGLADHRCARHGGPAARTSSACSPSGPWPWRRSGYE